MPSSRRARAAVARAATASIRALPLRRLLLVIIGVFVVLPLFVYDIATLDLNRARASSHAFFRGTASTPLLPRCLNVSTALLLTAEGRARVQRECGTSLSSSSFNSSSTTVATETIVHFVHVPLDAVPLQPGEQAPPTERVSFLQYAAVQSVRTHVAPTVMVLHYINKPPRGVWYTQCQRHLSLHKVVAPIVGVSLNVYARRQLMELLLMLRALRKSGGTAFSDFNTFVVRDALQHTHALDALVAGRAASVARDRNAFAVAVHALQAPANHPALLALEQELLTLVARDDPQLRDKPLEQLVAQLLTAQLHSSNATGLIVADSKLFDALPMDALPALTRVDADASAAAQRALHGAAALHVAKFDFVLQRNDTAPLRTKQELEQLSAEDALEGVSPMHALLRYAADLNTTAEIDTLLT